MNPSPESGDADPVEAPSGLAAQLAAGQAALAHAREQAPAPRRMPQHARTKLKCQEAHTADHTAGSNDTCTPAGHSPALVEAAADTGASPTPLTELSSLLGTEPETAKPPGTAAESVALDNSRSSLVVPADNEGDTVVIAPVPESGARVTSADDVVALVTVLADRARAAEQAAASARRVA